MNNEQLFRQALQRQNDRAARLKMPDDMEQRVMRRVKPRKTIRRWLYPISIAAAAASVLLLLTLQYNNKVESPIQQSHRLSQTNEIPTWQYEDELMRADACLTHQMEIKEKGERLAAYIHQQTTIDIQY
jgi:hypothetical protein